MLPHLYAEELILLWNNINMNGTITITPMFMNLPVSQHSIERIRVTPYFGQVPVTVVDVLGQVKYGDRPPCRFKWDFVLRGVTPEGCLLISTTVMLPYHGI
uniref:Nuclear transport factor 2 domain-containing protein n=1 Tax=Bracon brevicornis TaxID=1563983 RepID=A0A6V7HYG5_9HYME